MDRENLELPSVVRTDFIEMLDFVQRYKAVFFVVVSQMKEAKRGI